MENVARLYNHNKGETRKEIIDDFEKLGYNVECKILNWLITVFHKLERE